MNFVFVDITLLVLFVIFVSAFLYRNKKNLKRDGLLYLYRTQWGTKLIDKTGKRYYKLLGFLSYVSIAVGYALMVSMLWLFGKLIYLYIAYPAVVKAIKIPPITPLIPYLPQAFKLSFLPPFYFIYWILILAVIAITHEFAHGIFMRRYDIKIKSTGFGFFPFFLPVFLAAFVEQDEKSMVRSGIFKQMSVLSAGTFANIMTALVFGLVMIGFFVLSFAPAGVQFNTYSYSIVNSSSIDSINGNFLDNPTYEELLELSKEVGYNEITLGEHIFLSDKEFLISQNKNFDSGYLILYDNAPAINSGINPGEPITKLNDVEVNSWENLGNEINKYSPGEEVVITTTENEYKVVLGENPSNRSKAWLGIGFRENERSGLLGKFIDKISSFKKQQIHYEEKFVGAEFIYDFLWWLVLISFSVALVNMLPMGIFDGGRFFYLTILAITKKPKTAEKWFKGVTRFLLFLVILIMVFWVLGIRG
jgi:membrane-associated protease RseP (regulator of RpoE activity)